MPQSRRTTDKSQHDEKVPPTSKPVLNSHTPHCQTTNKTAYNQPHSPILKKATLTAMLDTIQTFSHNLDYGMIQGPSLDAATDAFHTALLHHEVSYTSQTPDKEFSALVSRIADSSSEAIRGREITNWDGLWLAWWGDGLRRRNELRLPGVLEVLGRECEEGIEGERGVGKRGVWGWC